MKTSITRALYSALLAVLLTFAPATLADAGLFVSGAFNYAQIDDDFGLDNNEIEDEDDFKAVFDDQSLGFNAGIGWRFNNWLSVDAGYWDFGEFKSDSLIIGEKAKIDTGAITAGAMVSVPLWLFDVYARGGLAFWETDAQVNAADDDGEDIYYGVGAALNVFSSIDLYLEVVRFDLGTDLDTANLGLRFTF